jgi:serine/threonine-protein kinase
VLDGDISPGTMVGEFRIEATLGRGGMATVYSAVQPLIGKRAAIKIMSRALCVDPPSVARFVQEARAVNQIGHPNIVDAFAFGTLPDGRSYMVMEWLQGETLAARMRSGPLGIGEAIAIIFQICDGLAAAHDKGIVHRDLKPENVFLVPVRNRRLLVKLLDFGIAKLRGPQNEPGVKHTMPGRTIGTPRYMAPEQARGKEVDYRADVYALGVTAYEMFTGRPPFLGEEAIDVMHQHVHALPPAPSLKRPDLPLQIERLLLQMLEKKPDKRPTLMQIEARLADERDELLRSGRDSGPERAIAGEVVGDGREVTPNKHIVTPRPVTATDSLLLVPARSSARIVGVIVAVALAAAAIGVGVALKVTAERRPIAMATPATGITAATAATEKPMIETRQAPRPPEPQPDERAAGTLALTVNVPNAAVQLDGEVLAESTPGGLFTVDKPGVHQLLVSAPKHRPSVKTIEVASGAELKVDVTLERIATTPARPTAVTRPTTLAPKSRPHNRDDMIDPFAGK